MEVLLLLPYEQPLPSYNRNPRPVRAGMVKQPGDWKWSSYLATVGEVEKPHWLEPDWILAQFGRVKRKAKERYKRFVTDGIGSPSPWTKLQGQIWLGSKAFLQDMERLIEGKYLEEVPMVQTLPSRPTKSEILESVAMEYGISVKELVERKDREAYRTAVYLLRRAVNLSLKRVAEEFGVSISRVSKIQGEAEREGRGESKLLKFIRRYKVKN